MKIFNIWRWMVMGWLVLSIGGQGALATDGSSGCGPGWYVFQESSLLSSLLRSTTNSFLYPIVTFGMTSGTSNCTQHSLVKTEQESLKYATENYYELLTDVATGRGEATATFAQIIGCSPQSIPLFQKRLRAKFNQLFPDHQADAAHLLTETYRIILEDVMLGHECDQVG